jgi:hypothetical protein
VLFRCNESISEDFVAEMMSNITDFLNGESMELLQDSFGTILSRVHTAITSHFDKMTEEEIDEAIRKEIAAMISLLADLDRTFSESVNDFVRLMLMRIVYVSVCADADWLCWREIVHLLRFIEQPNSVERLEHYANLVDGASVIYLCLIGEMLEHGSDEFVQWAMSEAIKHTKEVDLIVLWKKCLAARVSHSNIGSEINNRITEVIGILAQETSEQLEQASLTLTEYCIDTDHPHHDEFIEFVVSEHVFSFRHSLLD